MGFSIKRLFKSRETPEPEKVTTIEITDQQVRDAAAEVCLRELAFWTCIGKIANALTKCEFRTFYEGRRFLGMNITPGTMNRTGTRTRRNLSARP